MDKMMLIDKQHMIETAMAFDRPDFQLEEYLSKAAKPEDYSLSEKIERWRDEGIVVFENAIDVQDIDSLLQDIEYLATNRSRFDLEIEAKGQRHQLSEIDFNPLDDTGVKFNCLENISLAARKLSLNRFICSFLGHVFQEAPVALQSLTFWKGSNQPAHTDYPYVRTQTKLSHLAASWIPLEDVHEDSGPLAYYPGSHKLNVIEPFDWGGGSVVLEPDSTRHPGELGPYLQDELDKAGLKPKTFLPRKGDVLIWHGWVVHEGTPTRDHALTRRSYVTHYTGLSSYPKAHMYGDALQKKRYTSLNGGYVFEHPWVSDRRQLPSWS